MLRTWIWLVLAMLAVLFLFALVAGAQSPLPQASRLQPGIPAGGASVWYLGHCGYAVKTRNHFLIFDYQQTYDGRQRKSMPSRCSLDRGWIDPEEIKALRVRVFVSHSHEDHYDPVIFTWRKVVPDIAYYFGWKADDDPAYNYLIGPRGELTSGGLTIATINSHHSGVPEVAWLIKVDGLVIYHNGDCLPEDPAAEYDFLRTKSTHVDLAFVFPVTVRGGEVHYSGRGLFPEVHRGRCLPHARSGG